MNAPGVDVSKPRRFSRRRFIIASLLASPAAVAGDARWLEPQWVKTRRLRLSTKPAHRFVQFSDLHHKGDRAHTQSVVNKINSLKPDFVCFTGDIMEEARFLPEALEVLSGVKAPMYGVPGNHDYWSGAPFGEIEKCFASTGGAWLLDEARIIAGGKINLMGMARMGPKRALLSPQRRQHPTTNIEHPTSNNISPEALSASSPRPSPPLRRGEGEDSALRGSGPASGSSVAELSPEPEMKNILLMHYPAWAKAFDEKFDLMLAGHSHGGQVRIPFYGAIKVPFLVDEYDLGLFHTKAGPLYVNPGIGWFPYPIRFNCRPEITVIEI